MSADLQVKVETVVNEWMKNGFMFSAYDVTQKIRLNGDWVRHHAVRDIVLNLFNDKKMDDYAKTLVVVSSSTNGDSTFVYHHPSSDANIYQSDWVVNNPLQTGIKYVSSTSTSVSAPKSSVTSSVQSVSVNSITVYKTRENRINIPLKLVDSLKTSWETDDIIAAYKNVDNTMTLERIKDYTPFDDINTLYPNAKFYYVNDDRRIRVSSIALKKVFGNVDHTSQFKVSIASNNENLLVEPV